MVGEVISAKTAQTVKVKVASVKIHPKYKKRYVSTKYYLVHDEKGISKVGDKVELVSVRPISKLKRFAVNKILS